MDKFELKPCPFCGKKLKFYKETYVNSRGEKCNQWYFMHDVDDDCVLDTIFNVFTIPAGDANRETGYPGRCGVEWNKRASGWIPCSERMPPKRVAVLVYVIDNIHKIRFYAVAYLGRDIKNGKKNAWTFPTFPHQATSVQISSWMQYEVTHWMPLPDPPGGDE